MKTGEDSSICSRSHLPVRHVKVTKASEALPARRANPFLKNREVKEMVQLEAFLSRTKAVAACSQVPF